MVRLVFGVGGVGPEVGHGGFCEFGGGGGMEWVLGVG